MKSFFGATAILIACATLSNSASADVIDDWQRQAQLQLDSFRKNFDTDEGSCSLGILGAGSPVIVTRVSPLLQGTTLLESDRLLAINGVPVRGAADLRTTLGGLTPHRRLTVTVERGDETVELRTVCQDAMPVFRAHIEALTAAADGQWDECIDKTYLEELHWGGANSQSAGLRLWCHRAKGTAATQKWKVHSTAEHLSRIDAQFIFEHVNLLFEEMQHVPGGVSGLQSRLASRIQQIDESGHWDLSSQLRTKLASVETL